jgi:ferrous iron transport protein B
LKSVFKKEFEIVVTSSPPDIKKVILVGNPNVGKSVIFRLLTGNYVMVSNFPGTTVEVSRGRMRVGDVLYEVIDTPGVNSLIPQSEDEWVACEILLREKPDLIVQVADAKNLRRTLLITSQLVELGIPMVLVLNMIDEAEDRGIEIDAQGISRFFSIPVVETIAIYGKGKKQLLNALANTRRPVNPLSTLYARERVIQELNGVASPAFLSVEWLAENNRDLTRTLAGYLGEKQLSQLKERQERYHAAGYGNPVKQIGEVRNAMLDEAVASLKKKRRNRFVEEIGGFRKLWVSLLVLGLVLFAWNEFGSLLRIATPFTLLRNVVEQRLDASLSADYFGGNLVRSVLLGEKTDKGFAFGLVTELIISCF